MVIHVPDRKDLVTGFIFSALSAAAIAFIFSNSLQPAAVSGALSGGLLEKVNAFLSGAGLPAISEKLLRKTAHLCEFGLLGILTSSAACCFSGAALSRTRRPAAALAQPSPTACMIVKRNFTLYPPAGNFLRCAGTPDCVRGRRNAPRPSARPAPRRGSSLPSVCPSRAAFRCPQRPNRAASAP